MMPSIDGVWAASLFCIEPSCVMPVTTAITADERVILGSPLASGIGFWGPRSEADRPCPRSEPGVVVDDRLRRVSEELIGAGKVRCWGQSHKVTACSNRRD